MVSTSIGLLDIQSWWEIPCISHFCSLFSSTFDLPDIDIEDLESALLSDGTDEIALVPELVVRLLKGCDALKSVAKEITHSNYQMFLRRFLRQQCRVNNTENHFDTDVDFQSLPIRNRLQILQDLCHFRLDSNDVQVVLGNLEADSLRIEPLGHDSKNSGYWYFYGTRLYREDKPASASSKLGNSGVWQVICFTEEDWQNLTSKFEKSTNAKERDLYRILHDNFLPKLPQLFRERERLRRRKLLQVRNSSRIRNIVELKARQERERERLLLEEQRAHFETPQKPQLLSAQSRLRRRSQSTSTASGVSTYASSLLRTTTTNSSDFLCHRETFCLSPEDEDDTEVDDLKPLPIADLEKEESPINTESIKVENKSDENGNIGTEERSAEYLYYNFELKSVEHNVSQLNPSSALHESADSYLNSTTNFLEDKAPKVENIEFIAPTPPVKTKKSHHKKKKSQKKLKKKSKEHRRRHKYTTNNCSNSNQSVSNSSSHNSGKSHHSHRARKHRNHVHATSLSPEDKENFCRRRLSSSEVIDVDLHATSAAHNSEVHDLVTNLSTTAQQQAIIKREQVGSDIVQEMAPTTNTKLPGRQTNNSLSSLTGNIFIPPPSLQQSKGNSKSKTSKAVTSKKQKSSNASTATSSTADTSSGSNEKTSNSNAAAGSSTGSNKKKAVVASTSQKPPTEDFTETDEVLQIGMHKVLVYVKNHRDAWPFMDPVEEDIAPRYYSIIRRPMDLLKMEDKLDSGEYNSFRDFRNDFNFTETDEVLQIGMHKVLVYVKNHRDAWPFMDPVEEDIAPRYYSIIRRPMDLLKMEDKLDSGEYNSFRDFRNDFKLIVNNCRLYNGHHNEYTEMVNNLQDAFDKATKKYFENLSDDDDDEFNLAYPTADTKMNVFREKYMKKSKESNAVGAVDKVASHKSTHKKKTSKKDNSIDDDEDQDDATSEDIDMDEEREQKGNKRKRKEKDKRHKKKLKTKNVEENSLSDLDDDETIKKDIVKNIKSCIENTDEEILEKVNKIEKVGKSSKSSKTKQHSKSKKGVRKSSKHKHHISDASDLSEDESTYSTDTQHETDDDEDDENYEVNNSKKSKYKNSKENVIGAKKQSAIKHSHASTSAAALKRQNKAKNTKSKVKSKASVSESDHLSSDCEKPLKAKNVGSDFPPPAAAALAASASELEEDMDDRDFDSRSRSMSPFKVDLHKKYSKSALNDDLSELLTTVKKVPGSKNFGKSLEFYKEEDSKSASSRNSSVSRDSSAERKKQKPTQSKTRNAKKKAESPKVEKSPSSKSGKKTTEPRPSTTTEEELEMLMPYLDKYELIKFRRSRGMPAKNTQPAVASTAKDSKATKETSTKKQDTTKAVEKEKEKEKEKAKPTQEKKHKTSKTAKIIPDKSSKPVDVVESVHSVKDISDISDDGAENESLQKLVEKKDEKQSPNKTTANKAKEKKITGGEKSPNKKKEKTKVVSATVSDAEPEKELVEKSVAPVPPKKPIPKKTNPTAANKKFNSKSGGGTGKNSSDMNALDVETEQTLKDINRWLEYTPKFAEFSSASNSPTRYNILEEIEKLEPSDFRRPVAIAQPKTEVLGELVSDSETIESTILKKDILTELIPSSSISSIIDRAGTASSVGSSCSTPPHSVTSGNSVGSTSANASSNNSTVNAPSISSVSSANAANQSALLIPPPVTVANTLTTIAPPKPKEPSTTQLILNPPPPPHIKNQLAREAKRKSLKEKLQAASNPRRKDLLRTIDRLQPGKSKGNLIQNVNKTDETHALGPVASKTKEVKNALIVETTENTPKLSLGTVIKTDDFTLGKSHTFIDELASKTDAKVTILSSTEKDEKQKEDTLDPVKPFIKSTTFTTSLSASIDGTEKKTDESPSTIDPPKPFQSLSDKLKTPDIATASKTTKEKPNFSVWFKAFGAPKKTKKSDEDEKPQTSQQPNEMNEPNNDAMCTGKLDENSPPSNSIGLLAPKSPLSTNVNESFSLPTAPRQRKASTGSTISERSSFSQDPDSPRIAIDERYSTYGAGNYTSPIGASPIGASPIMVSPKPDEISKPTSPYPLNGAIKVGFYQDTTTKSSPDKSCSPREMPSPYPQYSQHIYSSASSPNVSTPDLSGTSPYGGANSYNPSGSEASKTPVYSATSPLPNSYEQYKQPRSQESDYNSSMSPSTPNPHSPYQQTKSSPYTTAAQPHHSPYHHPNSPYHSQQQHSPYTAANSPAPHSGSLHSPLQQQHSPMTSSVDSPASSAATQPPTPLAHSPADQQHSPYHQPVLSPYQQQPNANMSSPYSQGSISPTTYPISTPTDTNNFGNQQKPNEIDNKTNGTNQNNEQHYMQNSNNSGSLVNANSASAASPYSLATHDNYHLQHQSQVQKPQDSLAAMYNPSVNNSAAGSRDGRQVDKHGDWNVETGQMTTQLQMQQQLNSDNNQQIISNNSNKSQYPNYAQYQATNQATNTSVKIPNPLETASTDNRKADKVDGSKVAANMYGASNDITAFMQQMNQQAQTLANKNSSTAVNTGGINQLKRAAHDSLDVFGVGGGASANKMQKL
ncbi:uncharacterized protein LOC119677450 [Teleopsis dalmanni]|uniref:uncharacterized protein LOC119677450 n=1 Tax=Teleopsis dalmanni TaxID=139649 RepID=UPI0018CF1BC9|nr:uncharacterized protein LOC119677450 [Teleopsis dalmanni]